MFCVVKGKRPEATHRRRLVLLEGYRVLVCSIETLAAGIKIGVDVARRAGRVVVYVGLGGGGAGKIIDAPCGAVGRRSPAVADRTAVIVESEQWRDQILLSGNRSLCENVLDLWIFGPCIQDRLDRTIQRLFSRQRRNFLHHLWQLIEELFWTHPLRFAFASSRWRRELWRLVPVLGFHLPVELTQRIHHDLTKQRLHRSLVLSRVILKHARKDDGQIGRGAIHVCNTGRFFAFPIRPNQQVEARLGTILLSHLRECVGTRITKLVGPKPVAEVWDLYDNRPGIELL